MVVVVSYGFGYIIVAACGASDFVDGFDELSILMFTFVFCSTFEDDVASDFGDVSVGLNIFECGIQST